MRTKPILNPSPISNFIANFLFFSYFHFPVPRFPFLVPRFGNTLYKVQVSVMINVFLIGIDCYKPANGETVSMETIPTITVDMSLELLKRKVESLQRKGQSNNMHEPIITCNVHVKGE